MTSKEINEKIAEWLGFEGAGLGNTFNDPPGSNPYKCHILPTPDYYNTSAALDLLPVLTKRGYAPALIYDDEGSWACSDEGYGPMGPTPLSHTVCVDPDLWRDTPSAAICALVIWIIGITP